MKTEKISVLMPIYNCAPYLPAAIESILQQTYKNWELIMCDDGSRDGTYDVAKTFAKKYPAKIILLRNKTNLKMNKTLNKCLRRASGKVIARMDGDDICDPNRFQIEYDFLAKHREFALVSCNMRLFNDQDGVWGEDKFPPGAVTPSALARRSPFCHGGCMIRENALAAVGGYSTDENTVRVEDYDLWVRLYAAGFRGFNLNKSLYSMRNDRETYRRRTARNYLNNAAVQRRAVRLLKLPAWCYLFSLRSYVMMLIPKPLYALLQKLRNRA